MTRIESPEHRNAIEQFLHVIQQMGLVLLQQVTEVIRKATAAAKNKAGSKGLSS